MAQQTPEREAETHQPGEIANSSESGARLRNDGDEYEGRMEPVHRPGTQRRSHTLTNLVYNMVRFEQIERLGLKRWRTA